ncbi:MAG: hypothetical protein Q8N18_20710 [Opitutaceae bacterium]|nr:hypothetical protein [Opitutaceae bacterium]
MFFLATTRCKYIDTSEMAQSLLEIDLARYQELLVEQEKELAVLEAELSSYRLKVGTTREVIAAMEAGIKKLKPDVETAPLLLSETVDQTPKPEGRGEITPPILDMLKDAGNRGMSFSDIRRTLKHAGYESAPKKVMKVLERQLSKKPEPSVYRFNHGGGFVYFYVKHKP